MKNLLAWWRERHQRRAEREAERADDEVHQRVCTLTLRACDLWLMPVVVLDSAGAHITEHGVSPPRVVARYGGPTALGDLEAEVARRIAAKGEA